MEELKIEIGDWVILKDERIVKIMEDDMLGVPWPVIDRHATKEEILKAGGVPKDLKYRMYFFVPYNISPIQQAIQSGHAMGEYSLKYGRYNPTHLIWHFLEQWKTWIILNGGTTNDTYNFDTIATGSLNQIGDEIQKNKIDFSFFKEPDLNNALTAVCFLADERVWDYENYPEFVDYLINEFYNGTASSESIIKLKIIPYERLIDSYEKEFSMWFTLMGGEKNLFLRNLIKGKKLA